MKRRILSWQDILDKVDYDTDDGRPNEFWKKYSIVGIHRGGMIPAVLIARNLKKELLSFNTSGKNLDLIGKNCLCFVDEIVGEGRTYNKVKRFCKKHGITDWVFYALYIDKNAERHSNMYGETVPDWMFFPWEKDKVNQHQEDTKPNTRWAKSRKPRVIERVEK
jgi:hypoxanthine phosphoribosyltransferase